MSSDMLQNDNIPTLLDWDRFEIQIDEGTIKILEKNVHVKGSRIDDLNTAHMFIPLKLRKACRKLSSCVESVSLHPIKTPAVILSMTGSVLVAMPTTILRIAGFSVWMISNTLWFIQGQKVKDFYLMALFGFYFVTAAIGVYNLT